MRKSLIWGDSLTAATTNRQAEHSRERARGQAGSSAEPARRASARRRTTPHPGKDHPEEVSRRAQAPGARPSGARPRCVASGLAVRGFQGRLKSSAGLLRYTSGRRWIPS